MVAGSGSFVADYKDELNASCRLDSSQSHLVRPCYMEQKIVVKYSGWDE